VHFSISGHITKLPVGKVEAMLEQVMLRACRLPAYSVRTTLFRAVP
jgi:hypothetical protein